MAQQFGNVYGMGQGGQRQQLMQMLQGMMGQGQGGPGGPRVQRINPQMAAPGGGFEQLMRMMAMRQMQQPRQGANSRDLLRQRAMGMQQGAPGLQRMFADRRLRKRRGGQGISAGGIGPQQLGVYA